VALVGEASIEFGLQGQPDVLIASCLDPAEQRRPVIRQMMEGARLMLARRRWQAGRYRIGLATNH
jgi:hypothetical protein